MEAEGEPGPCEGRERLWRQKVSQGLVRGGRDSGGRR